MFAHVTSEGVTSEGIGRRNNGQISRSAQLAYSKRARILWALQLTGSFLFDYLPKRVYLGLLCI